MGLTVRTINQCPVGFGNLHKVYRLDPTQVIDPTVRRWVKSLRDKAAKFLRSGKVAYSGSVVGTGDGGSTIYVNFQNSMDDYLAYDYDKLGTFKVSNIFMHPIIQEMVAQMGQGILFRPERD